MAETSEQTPRQTKAQSLFQYGNDAAMKGNHDYAIAMYRDALKIEPGNLLFRQALRGAQRRAYNNDPKGVGRMIGIKIQPLKAGLISTKTRKNWLGVMETCEDIFKHNPWDVGAAEDAADAAEHMDLLPLAQWLLESVVAQAGESEHFFLRLAHAYELNEKWDQAIGCWERAFRINPKNDEAKRKVRSLSASAAITRSGIGASIDRASAEYDTANSPAAIAQAEADELKRSVQTPEQRLEKELEADPSRVGLYLQLAELHKSHNRLDDAEKVLAKARKAVPDDDVVRTAHGDVQLMRLRRAIDDKKRKIKENPEDKESRDKLAQFHEKLATYELAEFRRRVEARPEDSALHLHYGRLLAVAGKHDEAIGAFQKARSDPELKPKALHQAGLSFEAKGLGKLAEKNFVEALALADANDLKLRNSLRYRLGRVCEAQGKAKEAEEYYNEVAAEDYTYEDVAERLQALNNRDTS